MKQKYRQASGTGQDMDKVFFSDRRKSKRFDTNKNSCASLCSGSSRKQALIQDVSEHGIGLLFINDTPHTTWDRVDLLLGPDNYCLHNLPVETIFEQNTENSMTRCGLKFKDLFYLQKALLKNIILHSEEDL